MADDGARRAHALFVQALGIEGPEREAFLRTACAGDVPLRTKLDRLIAAAAQSTDFLETPALRIDEHGSDGALWNGPASISVRGYRVIRMIAAGGMAVVYEAMQEQPERRVALKVMNRALTHTSAVRRFRFETEVLARLRHPGVAQIFDAGTCDAGQGHPVPFFAMEFIEGATTLIEHVQREALPLRERLSKFAEVCDAVQHGHQHGVIHRDLKPGNILVGSDGRTRVIDFGVARSVDADQGGITRRADVGLLIGTLNYMSPEQCSASASVDIRADVYSLGVILYQLVAGRPPYELGELPIPEAVRTITEGSPKRPSSLTPAARGDLDAIIGTAIDKDPARRYSSAGALADDIRRYLNHQTIRARPPTAIHQMRLFTRRHRALAGAGLVVFLVLVAAGVTTVALAMQTARESSNRRRAEQQALVERDAARRTSYAATVGGAMAASQTNDFAQARSRLAAAPAELRNWEWSFVSAIVEQGEQVIPAHADMVYGFAMSADGRRLVSGSRDGSVALWDAASGAVIHRFDGLADAALHSVAFSADCTFVVAGVADHTVRVLDTASFQETMVFRAHTAPVESVACGPENVVASASTDGVARLWRADTGEVIRTFDDQPGGIHKVAFSPDRDRLITWNYTGSIWIRTTGDLAACQKLNFEARVECCLLSPDGAILAAGGAGGRIVLWDAESGEFLREISTAPSISTVRSLTFSPDGKWLAAGQIDRTISLWHVATGVRRSQLLGHNEAVSGLAVSDTGDRIFSASWDRTIRIWPANAAAEDLPVRTLEGHSEHVLATAYSPDGSLIASGGFDKNVCLWDAQQGSLLATLRKHRGPVYSVVFSPDGTCVASASTDGTIRLWNARTGECDRSIKTGGGLSTVAFSPDQQLLAAAGNDGVVRVWSSATTELVRSFPDQNRKVTCVAFSPDSAILASALDDGTVRLWEVASGTARLRLSGHHLYVYSVLFSRDGRYLYSGSRDQTVRVWNTRTGECVVLSNQGHLISALALNHDGSRLAAGSWFGEIALWDTSTYDLVFSFRGQQNAIRALSFSPDGRSLVCGGADISMRSFDAIPRLERAAIRTQAGAMREAAKKTLDRLAETHLTSTALAEAIERDPGIQPEERPPLWKALLSRTESVPVDRP